MTVNPTFLHGPNAGVWIVPDQDGRVAEARVHMRDGTLNARFEETVARAKGVDVAPAGKAYDDALDVLSAAREATADAADAVSKAREIVAGAEKALASAADDAKTEPQAALARAAAELAASQGVLDAAQAAETVAAEAVDAASVVLDQATREADRAKRSVPVRIVDEAALHDFERYASLDATRFTLYGAHGSVSELKAGDWFECAREVVRSAESAGA